MLFKICLKLLCLNKAADAVEVLKYLAFFFGLKRQFQTQSHGLNVNWFIHLKGKLPFRFTVSVGRRAIKAVSCLLSGQ